MIQTESKHPSGTVGYIYADSPPPQFYDCLERTIVPRGTCLMKATGYNAAHNRNQIIDEMEGEWVWLLDCDHGWEPDCLIRLLNRNVDAILPLYCRRYAPFDPVIYKSFNPETRNHSELYSWAEISAMSGCETIAASGAGGLLVRKHVLDRMEKPHFRVGLGNGQEWRNLLDTDGMHEDTGFGWRLRQAGFQLHVDLDVSMGHLADAVLVPHRQSDGSFSVFANINNCKVWLFTGETQRKIIAA